MVMMGYDIILMSHYDNYIIDYYDFKVGAPEKSVFEEIDQWTCRDFPGPGNGRRGTADFFRGFKPANVAKSLKVTEEDFEQFMKDNNKVCLLELPLRTLVALREERYQRQILQLLEKQELCRLRQQKESELQVGSQSVRGSLGGGVEGIVWSPHQEGQQHRYQKTVPQEQPLVQCQYSS